MIRRTLYFAGYGLTLIIVVLALFLFGWAMPFGARARMATLWPGAMSKGWLRFATGVKVEISGATKLPSGPFIAVCNHQSEWETLFLARFLCPTSIVMKESLLRIPVYGWGQRLLKPIAIDRGSPKASIRAMLTQGKARIEAGNNVLIFPEGTRVEAGSVRKYTRTAFKIAAETGAPIVPIVQNSGDYWLRKRFVKGTIKMVVGEPVSPEGLTAEALAKQVEQWSKDSYAKL